eukprot:gene777-68_t
MESLENVLSIIRPDVWMATVDLKDALYSIPLHSEHHKYFKFIWDKQFYRYSPMPNGYAEAMRSHGEVNCKDNKGECYGDHDYTPLAQPILVPNDAEIPRHATSGTATDKGTASFAIQTRRISSATAETATSSSSPIWQHIQCKVFSPEVSEIILHSSRKMTVKKYDSVLKHWEIYCREVEADPVQTSVNTVLKFLLRLYNGGCKYSGLAATRSALSSVVCLPGYKSIAEHPMISRFLKGVYNKHPPLPKYSRIWDISVVLKYYDSLPPNELLDLKQFTHKKGKHLVPVDVKPLFITYGTPHKPASSDTFSRWVKADPKSAGVDTSVFQAHSCGSASASKAKEKGIPLQYILKRGCWKAESTFRTFYDKQIINHGTEEEEDYVNLILNWWNIFV